MADITSTEGREELRRHLKTCDTLVRDLGHFDELDTALDGLDIAEEMAELLRLKGHTGDDVSTSSRWKCKLCRWLAEWDKWKGER